MTLNSDQKLKDKVSGNVYKVTAIGTKKGPDFICLEAVGTVETVYRWTSLEELERNFLIALPETNNVVNNFGSYNGHHNHHNHHHGYGGGYD